MTTRDVYPIVMEVLFGNKDAVFEIFKDRKYAGPRLVSILKNNGVKVIFNSSSEWRLEWDNNIKYLNLSTNKQLHKANKESIAVIGI